MSVGLIERGCQLAYLGDEKHEEDGIVNLFLGLEPIPFVGVFEVGAILWCRRVCMIVIGRWAWVWLLVRHGTRKRWGNRERYVVVRYKEASVSKSAEGNEAKFGPSTQTSGLF